MCVLVFHCLGLVFTLDCRSCVCTCRDLVLVFASRVGCGSGHFLVECVSEQFLIEGGSEHYVVEGMSGFVVVGVWSGHFVVECGS